MQIDRILNLTITMMMMMMLIVYHFKKSFSVIWDATAKSDGIAPANSAAVFAVFGLALQLP